MLSRDRKQRFTSYAHVKALVPVWVQRLLDYTGRVCLLSIYGYDRKGVGQTEDFALGKTIGCDNYVASSATMSDITVAWYTPVILIFLLLRGQQPA